MGVYQTKSGMVTIKTQKTGLLPQKQALSMHVINHLASTALDLDDKKRQFGGEAKFSEFMMKL